MSVMHLTPDSLRRLLDGTIDPPEARALAEHLASDCERCEALLADLPGADAADGRVDRALLSLAPPSRDAAGNDLEYARIRRRARAGGGTGRAVRLTAVAAAVLLAGGVALRLGLERRPGADAEQGREKGMTSGAPRAVPVRISAVLVGPDRRVERVAPGERVPADGSLEFRVRTGAAASVALIRVGRDGSPDAFWSQRLPAPADVAVEISGRPAAYPLAGLVGPQRFAAIASPEPLSGARLAEAARALAPPGRLGADAPALEGLSIDLLEVDVR